MFADSEAGRPTQRGRCRMTTQKAIVLVVPAEIADDVARLVAATLSLNGYRHDDPAVIDWPLPNGADAPTEQKGNQL